MGSHEWVEYEQQTSLGPVPGRWRVLVGRSAAIVLILGALSWIAVSLVFNPLPRAPDEAQSIPIAAAGTPEQTGSFASGSPPSAQESAAPSTGGATVVIHLIGAVKKPGVYSLPLGSRVLDAVKRAGGLAADAAPEAINLAAELGDGQQIRIPHTGDSAAAPPAGASQSAVESAPGGKLNINIANQSQLEELPGIGPALAVRILDFRTANGPFKSLAELDAVSGIGPALLGNLRDAVVFE
ncbi:competence protein ComEA [Arthrobacter sp. 7749]|nr:ComEA family DNA-binding protein [Paeniglutamicibacter terrestris]ASN39289.1 competence protein ComEA [Arthrobacter sp. 7749]